MWVARDKNGILGLFNDKPIRACDDTWKDVGFFPHYMHIDPSLFPDLKWQDDPIGVEIVHCKKEYISPETLYTDLIGRFKKLDLIKRFEILNMMYQSTDPESINHISFDEYALKHWDEVDMNYFDNVM